MPMLLALDSIYASRGDYFDAVFDSKLTIWEALTQIARTGRAVPLLRSGVVTLIRDQQRLLPVALYTNRNIARGSLSIDYVTASDDTPDGVEVTYFDALAWNQKRVTAAVPGVTTPAKPAKVQMFGVTGATQAQREARYIAANSVYRRKFLKFTTEMEGYIPAYGDLIAVSHDMPSWGVAGDVTVWDSATSTLTLSEPVEFTPGSTHYIALMRPNGSVSGPYEVAAGATADQVVLAGGLTPLNVVEAVRAVKLGFRREARSAVSLFWSTRVLRIPAGPGLEPEPMALPVVDCLDHRAQGAVGDWTGEAFVVSVAHAGGAPACFLDYGHDRDPLDLALDYGFADSLAGPTAGMCADREGLLRVRDTAAASSGVAAGIIAAAAERQLAILDTGP